MLSPSFPNPADNGEKRRVLAFAQRLSRTHEITFVSLREPHKIESSKESLGDDWGPTQICTADQVVIRRDALVKAFLTSRSYREVKFYSSHLQDIIDQLLRANVFDIIWVNFVTMAMYLNHNLPYADQRPKLILDQHNLDEDVWRKYLKSSNYAYRVFAARQLAKIKRFQAHWFPFFDAIISVSSQDRQATMNYITPQSSVWLAPNGVDTDFFYPMGSELKKDATKPVIMFGGSMETLMNQDAVLWYMESIHPIVQKQIPDVQFWIVGKNPPAKIIDLQRMPGIKITGTVDDVRDFYKEADVFVIPSRLGGGTKLKTLEALAMGLPTISTSIGAQGLNYLEDGVHLYVVDEAEAIAERIVMLLRNPQEARALGTNGYKIVRKHYDWDSIVEEIEVRLPDLLNQKVLRA